MTVLVVTWLAIAGNLVVLSKVISTMRQIREALAVKELHVLKLLELLADARGEQARLRAMLHESR